MELEAQIDRKLEQKPVLVSQVPKDSHEVTPPIARADIAMAVKNGTTSILQDPKKPDNATKQL